MKTQSIEKIFFFSIKSLILVGCTTEVHSKKQSESFPLAKGQIPVRSYAQPFERTNQKDWEALLDAGQNRDESNPILVASLKSSDSKMAQKAAYLASEMPGSVPDAILIESLSHPEPEVRAASGLALSQNLHSSKARSGMLQALMQESSARVLASHWENLGRLALGEDISFFVESLKHSKNPMVSEGIAKGLALFFRTQRTVKKPPMPFSFTKEQSDFLLESLRSPAELAKEEIAMALVGGTPSLDASQLLLVKQMILDSIQATWSRRLVVFLKRNPSQDSIPTLGQILMESKSPAMRMDALEALHVQDPSSQVWQIYELMLKEGSVNEKLSILSQLEKRGTYPDSLNETLNEVLQSGVPALQGAALKTLVSSRFPGIESGAQRLLHSPFPTVISDALSVLPKLLLPEATKVKWILDKLTHDNPMIRTAALNSVSQLIPSTPDVFIPLLIQLLNKDDERTLCAAIQAIGALGLREFEERIKFISQNSPFHFSRQCALDLFDKWGAQNYIKQLESLVTYPIIPIAQQAYDILKKLSSSNPAGKVPRYNGFIKETPPWNEVDQAHLQKVKFTTTQGPFWIQFFESDVAPYFVENFVSLVKQKYYNNNRIFRVEPSFVVQFGDPIGDGASSLGYLLRDSFSKHTHKRGSVGVATFGRDGGDAQIFINTQNNPGLNGSYTVFAEVTEGMETIEKLSPNDFILEASTYNP